MSIINGRACGGSPPLKTLTIVDENGQELLGVVVGKDVIFNATDNDVRENVTYASDMGVSVGTKVIPSYHTTEGAQIIMPGSEMILATEHYDYTKLQGLVCDFNTSLSNSVSTTRVVINNNIYDVLSTDVVSVVTKNNDNKSVVFGVANNTGKPQILRYFTYKEIY